MYLLEVQFQPRDFSAMNETSEGWKPAALKISVMGLHAAACAISMSDGTLSSSFSPLRTASPDQMCAQHNKAQQEYRRSLAPYAGTECRREKAVEGTSLEDTTASFTRATTCCR